MTYADTKQLNFDTWLLQSIMLTNVDGSGTAKRILDAADLMSKIPMAEADLRGGLVRLAQKGFIEDKDGGYSPTATAAGLKWSEREKIRQLLEAEPPTEEKKAAAGDLSKLAGQARDRLEKTTGDYVKKFQGFMSGLNKPKKE
jgi:hypothetical protein